MDSNGNEKTDRLKALNQKLYNKNNLPRPKRTGILHPKSYGISKEWAVDAKASKEEKPLPPSTFKKFFFYSAGFFTLALAIAGYILYGGRTAISTENIDIKILGSAFANGGETLPLQIEVSNRNTASLELADLLVEYPKGSSGGISDIVRVRRSLGNIPSGKSVDENIPVVLYGEQGSVKEIKATLEYRISGSNAIFIKEQKYQVTINQAPLSISIDAPEDTTPGQNITLNFGAKLNTSKPATGLLMRVDYPPGFQFVSANPEPSFGNNIWVLGDLPSGGEKKISVTGTLLGTDGDERTFHVYAGEASKAVGRDIGVVYNSLLHSVLLKKPFLQATLVINGEEKDTYTASSGSTIRGEIKYVNNLSDRLTDIEIRAKITGEVLDKDSIAPLNGFYDSVSNEIVWNKSTDRRLASLSPGDSDRLAFTFKGKSLVTSSKGLIQNPEIVTEISVKGVKVGESTGPREVDGFERKIVRINSDLQIFASSLYSVGPFKNTGSIPPKAEKETTYTISWKITNSANRINSASARTVLPAYVKFIKASSPTLTYNESTREVKWEIGDIAPGVGLTREGREVFFQVGFTPSTSQVDSTPELTGQTVIYGIDSFTGTNLENRRSSVNTNIPNDPSASGSAGRVVR